MDILISTDCVSTHAKNTHQNTHAPMNTLDLDRDKRVAIPPIDWVH